MEKNKHLNREPYSEINELGISLKGIYNSRVNEYNFGNGYEDGNMFISFEELMQNTEISDNEISFNDEWIEGLCEMQVKDYLKVGNISFPLEDDVMHRFYRNKYPATRPYLKTRIRGYNAVFTIEDSKLKLYKFVFFHNDRRPEVSFHSKESELKWFSGTLRIKDSKYSRSLLKNQYYISRDYICIDFDKGILDINSENFIAYQNLQEKVVTLEDVQKEISNLAARKSKVASDFNLSWEEYFSALRISNKTSYINIRKKRHLRIYNVPFEESKKKCDKYLDHKYQCEKLAKDLFDKLKILIPIHHESFEKMSKDLDGIMTKIQHAISTVKKKTVITRFFKDDRLGAIIQIKLKNELRTILNLIQFEKQNFVEYWMDLSGHEFEKRTAELFRLIGYSVVLTKGSDDKGIDFFIKSDESIVPVQCKNYSNQVSPSHIREFQGAVMSNTTSSKSIFIGSSSFSKKAIEQANVTNILLLDIFSIIQLNARKGNDYNMIIDYLKSQ